MKDNAFKATMVLSYADDGDTINVKMNYKDSNGVTTESERTANTPEEVASSIMGDIIKAMKDKKDKSVKDPQDMSKEELLQALNLMEKEANEQRAKVDMLKKRLKYENKTADPKNIVVEKPKNNRRENLVDYDDELRYIFSKFFW